MTGSALLFPFRAAPLLLVAVFTIALVIARAAGFAGLWLAVLVISWFFKYCFVLLDAIVAGEEEPPVLSVEMVNPLSEQRPLAAAAMIAAQCYLLRLSYLHLGYAASVPLAMVLLVALPATLAALAVTGNPLKAVWPGIWFAFARGLGRQYLLLVVAILAFGCCIFALWHFAVPVWFALAATQLMFLLIVAFIGGAIFAHRDELGIATLTRAERHAHREAAQFARERREVLHHAYGLVRVRQLQDAWQSIQQWLRKQDAYGGNVEEYRSVFDLVAQWREPAISDHMADELIGLWLAKRESGRAVEVCEAWLAVNPAYLPAQRTRLRELAALAGKSSLRRRLE